MQGKSISSRAPRRPRVSLICEQCGRQFTRHASAAGKYCSLRCRKPPLAERFWQKVEKSPEPDGCWEWTAARCSGGYGSFVRSHDRPAPTVLIQAHRMAWELTYGPPPSDLDVLHKCDNRACVRPDHLFLGTHTDNMRDMVAKGRRNPKSKAKSGEAHHFAKLTADDVRAIRARYALGGVTMRVIAAEYGVNTALIGRIILRQIWKSVED